MAETVGSGMVVAGSCSSNLTPGLAWELPYAMGTALKKKKRKKEKRKIIKREILVPAVGFTSQLHTGLVAFSQNSDVLLVKRGEYCVVHRLDDKNQTGNIQFLPYI